MERDELYSKTSSKRKSTEETFGKLFDVLHKLIGEENSISLDNFKLKSKISQLAGEYSVSFSLDAFGCN